MIRRFATAAALVAFASAPIAAQTNITGGVLSAVRYYPELSNPVADLGQATVSAGVEFNESNFLTFDFAANTLTIVSPNPVSFTAAAVNTYRFTDVGGTIAPFTSFSLVGSTVNGFATNRLAFDENSLSVNFQGLSVQRGNSVQLSFTTASVVPEPSTYALLGTGLLAVGGIAARRRKRTT
jgi:hypothetical protein